MNILFYFGHPAQYLFFKNSLKILKEKKHNYEIIIKSKDVLENLLISNQELYQNILPEGRKANKISLLFALIKREIRLLKFIQGKHFDLFIGTDPSLAHVGFFKKTPVITVLEDDIQVVPQLAKITFPFTSLILTPKDCKTGRYEKKTIHYEGYMKLAYLHPNRFSIISTLYKQPYFLIRVSKLDAYHDVGKKGFTVQLLHQVVSILQKSGLVLISSEGILDPTLGPLKLDINPSEMHQVLANASLLICDSQSMTMEASMLGVPSVRFSDFAGKISVLEELEKTYGLTYGIPTTNPDLLFQQIDELLAYPELEIEFQNRRKKMLKDKIDVTAFLVWFIENFPQSVKVMKENPDYQNRFK